MTTVRKFLAIAVALFGSWLSLAVLIADGPLHVRLGAFLIVAMPSSLWCFLVWPRRPSTVVSATVEAGSSSRPKAVRPYARKDHTTPRGAFPEYWIEYSDTNGEITQREIWILSIDVDDPDLVKAWCFEKSDVRTFRSSRVLKARYLPNGERITNLAVHFMRPS